MAEELDPLTKTMMNLVLPAMLDSRVSGYAEVVDEVVGETVERVLQAEKGPDDPAAAAEGATAPEDAGVPAEARRRRGTGPRTARGKARVSQNAVTHGLLSQAALMPGEDPRELAELRAGLRLQLRPEGELEALLVDQMVASAWRLRRLHRVEAGLMELELRRVDEERADDTLKGMSELYVHGNRAGQAAEWKQVETNVSQHPVVRASLNESMVASLRLREPLPTLGLAFERIASGADPLAKLARYTAPIEKSFYRALHELQRLQVERRGEAVPPPVTGDLDVHLSR